MRFRLLSVLGRDSLAAASAVFLVFVLAVAAVGPLLVGDLATDENLNATDVPPFHLSHGWEFFLGSDSLGRSEIGRLIVGARTDLSIVIPTVILSMLIGMVWGMLAGYWGGWRESLSMRIADIILSFPMLLIAAVTLYIFQPRITNLIIVLTIVRIPLFLRTARAQVKEIRSRLFVDASRTFGTTNWKIISRHIAPLVLPTATTLAALDFCYVMLTAASLSYLGLGVQPPSVSWGLMVSQGQNDLNVAWWEAVWPGLMITLTTVATAILAAWARTASDPTQRWRYGEPAVVVAQ